MHWIFNFKNGKGPCRVNQAAASVGHYIYSFGGYSQQTGVVELMFILPIDVHVLNTYNLTWTKRPKPDIKDPQYVIAPYFRYGHTCVTYKDLIYLWAGRADWTNNLCNTLFAYEPNKHLWSRVNTNGVKPEGRDGHSACVINDSMLIFGGYMPLSKKFGNDVHEFNFKNSTWTLIVPRSDLKPHWRDFHTASGFGNRMYIFGGRMDVGHDRFTGDSFYLNDLYAFDLNEKIWIEIKPSTSSKLSDSLSTSGGETLDNNSNLNNETSKSGPCGRRSHSAVVHNRKIIIFGGFQENIFKHYNDLYEFDLDKYEWRLIKASGKLPSPRRRHSSCVINNRMYIFGGTGSFSETLLSHLDNQIQNVREQTTAQTNSTTIANNNSNDNENPTLFQSILNDVTSETTSTATATTTRESLQTTSLNQTSQTNQLAQILVQQSEQPTTNELNEIRELNDNNPSTSNDLRNNLINRNLAHHFNSVPIQNILMQQPQQEFAGNIQEYREDNHNESDEQNNNNNNNILINELNLNNNNVFEEEDDYDLYYQDETEYTSDSGDEDLIDNETEDDEGDLNDELISLSDLHVLDLDVPSLRTLCMLEILKKKLNYEKLPKDLINELDFLKD